MWSPELNQVAFKR